MKMHMSETALARLKGKTIDHIYLERDEERRHWLAVLIRFTDGTLFMVEEAKDGFLKLKHMQHEETNEDRLGFFEAHVGEPH